MIDSISNSQNIKWTSSNPDIAIVSHGVITAVGAGTAIITATSVNGKTASCIITVSNNVISITNPITATVNIGDIYTLPTAVIATLSGGTTKALAVTWDKPAITTTAGTYKFTGTLTMVNGIVNTNNITATTTLIVRFIN